MSSVHAVHPLIEQSNDDLHYPAVLVVYDGTNVYPSLHYEQLSLLEHFAHYSIVQTEQYDSKFV